MKALIIAALLSVVFAEVVEPMSYAGEKKLKMFGFERFIGGKKENFGFGYNLNFDLAVGYTFALSGDDIYTYLNPTFYVIVGGP